MVDAFPPPPTPKRTTASTTANPANQSNTSSTPSSSTSTSIHTSVSTTSGSSKQKRRLDMNGGNEMYRNTSEGKKKKMKIEYEHLVKALSGAVKEALNRFREISEMELDRLRKEGFDLPTSVHKLVDKMRTSNSINGGGDGGGGGAGDIGDMEVTFTRKEIETVMELSGFNEEGARRALILKQEISKLKKEGFNHPEAIDELSRRMKRLTGLKRKSHLSDHHNLHLHHPNQQQQHQQQQQGHHPLSLSGFMLMMNNHHNDHSKRFKHDPSTQRKRKRYSNLQEEEDLLLQDQDYEQLHPLHHRHPRRHHYEEDEEMLLGNTKKKVKTSYDFLSDYSSDEGDNATGSSDDGSVAAIGSNNGDGAGAGGGGRLLGGGDFPFSFSIPFEGVDVAGNHHLPHLDEVIVDGFSVDNMDDGGTMLGVRDEEGDDDEGDEEERDEESIPSGEDFDSEEDDEEEGEEQQDNNSSSSNNNNNMSFPSKDEVVWHFGNPLLKSKKRRDNIPRHSRQHNHQSIS